MKIELIYVCNLKICKINYYSVALFCIVFLEFIKQNFGNAHGISKLDLKITLVYSKKDYGRLYYYQKKAMESILLILFFAKLVQYISYERVTFYHIIYWLFERKRYRGSIYHNLKFPILSDSITWIWQPIGIFSI